MDHKEPVTRLHAWENIPEEESRRKEQENVDCDGWLVLEQRHAVES
jgi:hypothetical protein